MAINYDMNAEVTAKLALGILIVLQHLGVNPAPFIKRHHLAELQPEDWVKVSAYLSLLDDINTSSKDMFSLVSVGSKIIELADRVPNINTIQDIFLTLNDNYHLNHRNGEIGQYIVEVAEDKHIRVTAENPYPSDFDYGLMWGMAKAFCPQGTFVKVVRAESPSRLKGDDRCIYDITW